LDPEFIIPVVKGELTTECLISRVLEQQYYLLVISQEEQLAYYCLFLEDLDIVV
jgi:hypothetical protein